jgi:predicted amidophosphoribosyltransferase
VCPVCGQLMGASGGCANYWCRRADRAFTSVYSVGSYQGRLRAAIIDYKYRGARWRAEGFARLLAGYLANHATWFEEYDVVVGVPAYTRPGARRRWDPVGDLLRGFARMQAGSWEVAPGALVKVVDTPALSGLSTGQRRWAAARYLRQALTVPSPSAVAGCRVIAVDDVVTEGSTLQEVALTLLYAGAAEVAGLVLARPRWRRPVGQ